MGHAMCLDIVSSKSVFLRIKRVATSPHNSTAWQAAGPPARAGGPGAQAESDGRTRSLGAPPCLRQCPSQRSGHWPQPELGVRLALSADPGTDRRWVLSLRLRRGSESSLRPDSERRAGPRPSECHEPVMVPASLSPGGPMILPSA